MDKKKKRIIIIASAVAAILVIAGICIALLFGGKEKQENIADAENTYEQEYSALCTYEHSSDISIDGVLEEVCWQNKSWFTNTFLANTGNNMPVLNMTSFVDEYGIYIAAIAEDSNIVNDGQRNNNTNSNFEFYITACNVGESLVNDTINTLTINIDVKGDASCYYTNLDRAVVVNGEVNSGETESAVLELFVPWETLGIDKSKGTPTEFYCMPSWLAVFPGQESTTVMKPVWYPYKFVTDSYVFNADGYTTKDREGAVVGDSIFGSAKTANWDISKEAEGIIRSSIGTENHKIFFTGEYGPNYIVEATMIPVQSLQNNAPKAGIYFQTTTGFYNAVFLDMKEKYLSSGINGTRNFGTIRVASLHNNDGWNMTYLDEQSYVNPNVSTKEGVTLTVIKYGSKYWIFVDGNFITTVDYYFMDIDVVPGFFALGADVIYKDYSCTKLTEDSLREYVNGKNLYMIDAQIASAGGDVTTSEFSVEKGGSYDININTNSGYEVSSVLINGEEKIEDVKKNASGGVYTVKNVSGNQDIRVSYTKCEGHKFTGQIVRGEEYLFSTIMLEGLTNKALSYEINAAGEKGFSAVLPAGTYKVTILTEGCQTVADTITVSGDMAKNYSPLNSAFVESVEVNGQTITSKLEAWNTKEEHLGKVTTSYDAGGKTAPLYFNETAADFVVEATIDYTTVFKNGVEYQPDLMGGFIFNDGTNSGWIMARKTGVVYTGWNRVTGFIDQNVLTYPDKQGVKFAIAKTGDSVYVYMNDRLVETYKWSEIAPKVKADAKVAIGLYMVADKKADITFSNYSLKTGNAAVEKYMEGHVIADVPIAGSPFAETVTVNGVQLASALSCWDLSDVTNGNVFGSYALKSKSKPLYFNTHGSSIIAEAKIEYTTAFKEGEEYQPDLMGGFMLSDGTHKGWVVANKTGVVFTGWNKNHGLVDENVLVYDAETSTSPRSVKMTMVVNEGYIYIYFDDEFVWKQKLEVVVPNVDSDADLAAALYMVADKTADIKFSDISISNDEKTVTEYIKTHK